MYTYIYIYIYIYIFLESFVSLVEIFLKENISDRRNMIFNAKQIFRIIMICENIAR